MHSEYLYLVRIDIFKALIKNKRTLCIFFEILNYFAQEVTSGS